jgi:diacylglycerol kinase
MTMRRRSGIVQRARSFGYALAGIAHVLRTQPNAWLHAAINAATVAMGLWLGIAADQWAVLVLAMMAVWVAEFVNTALEAVVDLVTDEDAPLAAVAKDVAAGGVLVAAIGAVAVGLLVLGPPLWERLAG